MPILTPNNSQNVVLLSAGSGSRMGPLTSQRPKSLLEVGNKTVLDWMLDAIIARTDGEIVVVTGFQAEAVEQHLAKRYGERVKTVRNPRYEDDVNILSVEIGVAALSQPELGYLIAETDLLLDVTAWDKLFLAAKTSDSYWVCKGQYHKGLTGGIVKADLNGNILAVEYQPDYKEYYNGWAKMVGLLLVGPREVHADRLFRQHAISQTTRQYYLVPWHQHLQQLPCRVLDLVDGFAASFNTEADFYAAMQTFLTFYASDRLLAKNSVFQGVVTK